MAEQAQEHTTLSHRQPVFVRYGNRKLHGKMTVGIVYSPIEDQDDLQRYQRNYLRGDDQAWVLHDVDVLSAEQEYYVRRDAERVGAVEVRDGETYLVSHGHGQSYPMRAKVNGDYSDMVSFEYVGELPSELHDAEQLRDAGILSPSPAPEYY